MNPLDHIAEKIIQEQELIIGPLAWSEASKVSGLSVSEEGKTKTVHIEAIDHKAVVDALVAQYERLFGRASHEACRAAVASLLANMSLGDIPTSLRV
ncbi:MAG: hypothetical protein WCI89_00790 [bacterium]